MSINHLIYSITCPKNRPIHSNYDYQKIIVINTFYVLSVITLLILGTLIFLRNRSFFPAGINLITVTATVLIMAGFRATSNFTFYKSSVIAISALFFIYLVATGGIDNTGPLWSYIFPILSYYILGHKKATAVITGEILIYSVIIFIPGFPLMTANYTLYFKLRFILSTIFVTVLAFSLEYARFMAAENKEKLIIRLQNALNEIETLNGLIPICARCKKVRNDEGYWEQVESYIQSRTKASFTHSLCIECSDTLYGKEEWYRKK